MNKLVVVALSLSFGSSLAIAKKAEGKTEITAPVEAKSGAKLTGKVDVKQDGKKVKLKLTVEGAPEGEHAVHVHENADCSDPDGKKAGGHWNPTAEAHGQWGHEHFHMGDVGNMKVGKDGKGELTFSTDKWTLGGTDDKTDVLGHALIIHEKVDDFTTQPTGNAGNRIGCAVLAKPAK